ncbi:hypothetical protein EDB89DRAFT_1910341 [Lactarius sanguifluus]|nr:hypothetical protein EDB89DRAFT_1910341 [Lactarius sanguifluus]
MYTGGGVGVTSLVGVAWVGGLGRDENKTKEEKQLNEVVARVVSVAMRRVLANRVGSAVVGGAFPWRGTREVEGDGAMSLRVARRQGSCSGDVITRPKPSSSSSARVFARHDSMTSGRGFPRGGVLVVDVDGDGATSLRVARRRGSCSGNVSSRPTELVVVNQGLARRDGLVSRGPGGW